MVFGVFDLLHPGHLYLLYHARLRGKELVAVIARDAAAKRLKGSKPAWTEQQRLLAVKMTGLATRVVLGDAKEGNYAVIRKHHPNLICLGYDQSQLRKDLNSKMRDNRLPKIPTYALKPYKADVFHTSLRRKRKR